MFLNYKTLHNIRLNIGTVITLLTDNRRSFIFENLRESLIVQCNNRDTIEWYVSIKIK